MRRRGSSRVLWGVSLALSTALGCADLRGGGSVEDEPGPILPPGGGNRSAVVGVAADPELNALVEVVTLNVAEPSGIASPQTRWSRDAGDLVFPLERAVPPLDDGSPLAVSAAAWDAEGALLVERRLETTVRRGRDLLLPLWLNDECLSAEDEPDVTCPERTCAAGICVNPRVKPEGLPDYAPGWSERGASCGQGEPEVTIGLAAPFRPLDVEDVLMAEAGNQGLAHLDLAVRARGLSPSSLTVIMGRVPETGQDLSPTWYDRPYDEAAGCVVDELRFVLPLTWDTRLQLGATVIEPTGHALHRHVEVFVEGPTF